MHRVEFVFAHHGYRSYTTGGYGPRFMHELLKQDNLLAARVLKDNGQIVVGALGR